MVEHMLHPTSTAQSVIHIRIYAYILRLSIISAVIMPVTYVYAFFYLYVYTLVYPSSRTVHLSIRIILHVLVSFISNLM